MNRILGLKSTLVMLIVLIGCSNQETQSDDDTEVIGDDDSTIDFDNDDDSIQDDDDSMEYPLGIEGAQLSSDNNWIQVSVGSHHSCGLKTNGEIQCWGCGEGSFDYGQCHTPAGIYREVRAAVNHNCAIVDSDNTTHCWGWEAETITQRLAGQYLTLQTGVTTTCGVRFDGQIVCAGWDGLCEDAPDGQYTAPVVANNQFACGMDMEGHLTCWGENEYGLDFHPTRVISTAEMSQAHGCAVDANNELLCWGCEFDSPWDLWMEHSQCTPPEGMYKDIQVSGNTSCAITSDDDVVCWGEYYTNSTDGALRSLDVGPVHSCGITEDSYVVCWGNNGAGQAGPP